MPGLLFFSLRLLIEGLMLWLRLARRILLRQEASADRDEPVPTEPPPVRRNRPPRRRATPRRAESTPSRSEPPPPSSEPTTRRSEPATSRSEPATSRSEPTPPGSEPTSPGSEPAPRRSEPAPRRSEPAPRRSEPTSPGSEPTPRRSEPTRGEVAAMREAEREAETGGADSVGAEVHVAEPWPGYDDMSLDDLLARLQGANEVELAVVRAYEREHEARQAVLLAAGEEV
jgi:hypothetical protein